MHETSLIEFTLKAVEGKAAELGIDKVKVIHLTCGKMRGAVPLLMKEAFNIMTRRRPMFDGARLEMDETPILLKCRSCGRTYQIDEFHGVTCPYCGDGGYEILSGNELRIDYFEGDD